MCKLFDILIENEDSWEIFQIFDGLEEPLSLLVNALEVILRASWIGNHGGRVVLRVPVGWAHFTEL